MRRIPIKAHQTLLEYSTTAEYKNLQQVLQPNLCLNLDIDNGNCYIHLSTHVSDILFTIKNYRTKHYALFFGFLALCKTTPAERQIIQQQCIDLLTPKGLWTILPHQPVSTHIALRLWDGKPYYQKLNTVLYNFIEPVRRYHAYHPSYIPRRLKVLETLEPHSIPFIVNPLSQIHPNGKHISTCEAEFDPDIVSNLNIPVDDEESSNDEDEDHDSPS